MNRDALRKETCIIIRKHGEYLVGSILYSEDLRWSGSMYDAWRTRDREEARNVARERRGDGAVQSDHRESEADVK